ncbi:unnamed protein product, partial [Polarella glacialis]
VSAGLSSVSGGLRTPGRSSRTSSVPYLITTPEPRGCLGLMTPPPAPCVERERKELEQDVELGLSWKSEALVTMTLLRSHGPQCPGDHPLHEAINRRNLQALAFLIDCGRDVEEPCCGVRPLLRAV